MIKRLCLIAAFSLLFNSIYAQVVPDSYRQQKEAEMLHFKDSISNEYVKYLERLWTEYRLFLGEPSPRSVEPQEQPQIDTADTNALKTDRGIEYSLMETRMVESQPLAVNGQQSVITRNYTVQFYGRELNLAIPKGAASLKLDGISERQVAHYWKRLLENHAEQSIISLDNKRRDLYLNDWGMFDMTRHLAAAVYPNRPDEQAVFTIFLLDALHYDVRVGRMDDRLVMLLNTGSRLYDIPYVEIGTTRYYAFGNLHPQMNNLRSYDRPMPQTYKSVDMHLTYSPRLGGALSSKKYGNTVSGHKVELRVNQPLMDFYASYPQTELHIYATAAMEEAFAAAIERELKPFVESKSPVEALNSLLGFMQRGFTYQPDRKQFGHEKNYFCEENFYYPANDCEDRAVLFAKVVKQLLGYDVVLLEYDDHVATAVNLPVRVSAEQLYLDIEGRRYTVCDPTCLNAKVGQVSPRQRGKKARVILTK